MGQLEMNSETASEMSEFVVLSRLGANRVVRLSSLLEIGTSCLINECSILSNISSRCVNMVGQLSRICSVVCRPVRQGQLGVSFNLHLCMCSARLL